MAYILFKNITTEGIDKIVNFLNSVCTLSKFSPSKECALGICTTTVTNNYAYLNEVMCNRENPYISWIMCRKEYFTVEDFINAVKEHIDEYNKYYKEINERYNV